MSQSINITSDFEVLYPNASAKATECAMNLALTADLLEKRVGTLLQPFNLTPSSGLVLSILANSASSLPPNEIADRLIVSRATVTGLLDSLERHSYIKRLSHPSDRRMILIEITDKGRQVADDFRQIVHQYEKHWLEVLDETEQQQLIVALHRLQQSLQDSN